MTQTYSISDLAAEFDVTTRSIRFYEDKGLLSPLRKGTTRVYSNQDRIKLKLILRGKRLGLSLDEAREIIEMYNPQEGNATQLTALLERIRSRKARLHQQLVELNKMLTELEQAEQRCLTALGKQ